MNFDFETSKADCITSDERKIQGLYQIYIYIKKNLLTTNLAITFNVIAKFIVKKVFVL